MSALTRIEAALREAAPDLTPSGRLIAAYLRDNLELVPFETGASIAAKAGVSEMTVIRFLRSLGYASLRDLKDDLRAARPDDQRSFDDVLERFRIRDDGLGDLRESLELEIRAIASAYALVTSKRWRAVVDLLAARPRVYVTGFQATKGMALDFASRLKYAREGVRFAEGATGVYSEIVEERAEDCCVVIVDTVLYARKGVLLARRVRDRGIPLVVITDRFSNWAYEFTDLVLQGSTHVRAFWDSTASLSVIGNLLIDSVAKRLGSKARDRFERMKELGDYFQEFEPLRGPAAQARRERPGAPEG